jgi:hypothetical protein
MSERGMRVTRLTSAARLARIARFAHNKQVSVRTSTLGDKQSGGRTQREGDEPHKGSRSVISTLQVAKMKRGPFVARSRQLWEARSLRSRGRGAGGARARGIRKCTMAVQRAYPSPLTATPSLTSRSRPYSHYGRREASHRELDHSRRQRGGNSLGQPLLEIPFDPVDCGGTQRFPSLHSGNKCTFRPATNLGGRCPRFL